MSDCGAAFFIGHKVRLKLNGSYLYGEMSSDLSLTKNMLDANTKENPGYICQVAGRKTGTFAVTAKASDNSDVGYDEILAAYFDDTLIPTEWLTVNGNKKFIGDTLVTDKGISGASDALVEITATLVFNGPFSRVDVV